MPKPLKEVPAKTVTAGIGSLETQTLNVGNAYTFNVSGTGATSDNLTGSTYFSSFAGVKNAKILGLKGAYNGKVTIVEENEGSLGAGGYDMGGTKTMTVDLPADGDTYYLLVTEGADIDVTFYEGEDTSGKVLTTAHIDASGLEL